MNSILVISAHPDNEILGVDNLESLNFPDSRLDSIDLLELIKVVNHQARFIGSQLGVEAVEPFTLMRSIV